MTLDQATQHIFSGIFISNLANSVSNTPASDPKFLTPANPLPLAANSPRIQELPSSSAKDHHAGDGSEKTISLGTGKNVESGAAEDALGNGKNDESGDAEDALGNGKGDESGDAEDALGNGKGVSLGNDMDIISEAVDIWGDPIPGSGDIDQSDTGGPVTKD